MPSRGTSADGACGATQAAGDPPASEAVFRAGRSPVGLSQRASAASAAAAAGSQVLDQAEALSRAGGDQELLKEVVAIFLSDCSRVLSEIRAAIACGDANALEFAAHELKGAAAGLAARAAADAAWRLEQIGRANDLTQADELMVELEKRIEELKARLADVLAPPTEAAPPHRD